MRMVASYTVTTCTVHYTYKYLHVQLLDHEVSPTRQVPLLLEMMKYESALDKAINSGDPELGAHDLYALSEVILIICYLHSSSSNVAHQTKPSPSRVYDDFSQAAYCSCAVQKGIHVNCHDCYRW